MSPCFYKKYLGIECPGCGMQRSIYSLMKGDFLESFYQYPPLIFIFILLITLCLHIKFNFSYGPKLLKVMFVLTAVVILTNYIAKLLINGDAAC